MNDNDFILSSPKRLIEINFIRLLVDAYKISFDRLLWVFRDLVSKDEGCYLLYLEGALIAVGAYLRLAQPNDYLRLISTVFGSNVEAVKYFDFHVICAIRQDDETVEVQPIIFKQRY